MFKKILVALGMSVLLLTACSQTADGGNSADLLGPSSDSDTTRDIDIYEAELAFNYSLLDFYYAYGHARNELADNYKAYLNMGTSDVNSVKGGCSPEFYDVCYMFNQMRDPFTQYFDYVDAQRIYNRIFSSRTVLGSGVEVEEFSGENGEGLRVTDVCRKSPGNLAGLKAGDEIYSVNDQHVVTQSDFNNLCSGNKGDVVNMVVVRGEDTLAFEVEINEYYAASVKSYYVDSIPVIQINQFVATSVSDSGSYGEFIDALKKTNGAKSTIIDLRGNPGGDTDQCDAISAAMLSKGDTIIIDVETMVDSVMEEKGWRYFQAFDTIVYRAEVDGLGKDRYYVFLADSSSASCSEVVLSAIAVNKESPIVGQLTYGKGIGQFVFISSIGKGISLITAMQGMDKNGNSYHDKGILPDFALDNPDEQMANAVALAKEMSAVRTAGYGTTSTGHFSKKSLASEARTFSNNLDDMKMRFRVFSN